MDQPAFPGCAARLIGVIEGEQVEGKKKLKTRGKPLNRSVVRSIRRMGELLHLNEQEIQGRVSESSRMRVALIASPFISVPPVGYGGTELFVANLAEALLRLGVEVDVYANGDSRVKANLRSRYPRQDWPLSSETSGLAKELDHTAWAVDDAEANCDMIHVSSALAVPFSRFSSRPFVCTLHHPVEGALTDLYERHRTIAYTAISKHQASLHPTLHARVIHHGLDLSKYRFHEKKQPYVAFLGRICPIKGPHNAIAIAKRAGIPLKIAGEVQPIFRDYFEKEIRPHLDGHNIEFVGEVGLAAKNELLGHATALLFPIEWQEPFGLTMIESMACGTPIIAFPGGSVEELIDDGVSGRVCRNVGEAAAALQRDTFQPKVVRHCAETRFSADAMARQYYRLYSDLLRRMPLIAGLNPEETAA
jgi:glycosyltransferase involved in cell wall biosynthesis